MQQDILINGTSFNVAHNAGLTEADFLALHGSKFATEAAARKAHKDIKAAAGSAPKAKA